MLRYCRVIAVPMRRPCSHATLIPFVLIPAVIFGGMAAAAEPRAGDIYPTRPIRIVVPAASGGGVDIFARLIATGLTEAWGQPVVVDNKPGGGQTIGTEIVAKSAADGYTLLCTSNAFAVLPGLYPKLTFDPVRDFAPISLLVTSPNVLVAHPSLPVSTVRDFIAFAKARPHQLNFGSSGNGGTGHLAMEHLKLSVGIDLVHVPYRSSAPLLNALISGEVTVGFIQIVIAAPHIRAKRLRPLGVSTMHRSTALPDVPTIAEAGVPGFDAAAWFGILAPARTPPEIVGRLGAEIARTFKRPEVRARLAAEGAEIVAGSPEQFAETIRSDVIKWGNVVKTLGIKPE
jgi:tripartite-type tricarboxylate transporter receptor subunit TctC